MAQIILLIGFLIVLVLIWRLFKAQDQEGRLTYEVLERSAMPSEIASARLVYSERTLFADHPKPLVARVDQVYLTPAGLLVPVETKRRYRPSIYSADVIELSVQATVLANNHEVSRVSRQVANYGYVRIAAEGRNPVYLRTPLLDQSQVAMLHERYFALHEGRQKASPSSSLALCRKCGHRSRCPSSPALQ
jgi:hypothetical protein